VAPAPRRVAAHLEAGAAAEPVVEERRAQRRRVGAVPLAVEVAVPARPACRNARRYAEFSPRNLGRGLQSTGSKGEMFENEVSSRTHGAGRVAAAVEGGVSRGPRATYERCVPVRVRVRLGVVVAEPQPVRVRPHMPVHQAQPAREGEREQRGEDHGQEDGLAKRHYAGAGWMRGVGLGRRCGAASAHGAAQAGVYGDWGVK
jgi:hypothetical protein